MADKKSFALRIDADTMKAVEKWAADEFRSVNGQIEWVLHRALREVGRIRQATGRGDEEGATPENATDPPAAGPPG